MIKIPTVLPKETPPADESNKIVDSESIDQYIKNCQDAKRVELEKVESKIRNEYCDWILLFNQSLDKCGVLRAGNEYKESCDFSRLWFESRDEKILNIAKHDFKSELLKHNIEVNILIDRKYLEGEIERGDELYRYQMTITVNPK